jgi:hypothetical protein
MLSAKNLRREIIMDDSIFFWSQREKARMSNLENHRGSLFIFYRCSKALERISIRNAKYGSDKYVCGSYDDIRSKYQWIE